MPKFAVRIQGENYKLEMIEKRFLFLNRSSLETVGFYATRFIESESANEAISRAFNIIEAEIKEFAQLTENSKLELDEIKETDESNESFGNGSGFIFYKG